MAYTTFSKPFSPQRTSRVSHLSGCKIASPLPFHFKFPNSAPGSISKPVIGSLRGWASVEYLCSSPYSSWNKPTPELTFHSKTCLVLPIPKPLHLKNCHPSQSHPLLCVTNSKYNLCLKTRMLSKLFWKIFYKISLKSSRLSSLMTLLHSSPSSLHSPSFRVLGQTTDHLLSLCSQPHQRRFLSD